MRPPARWLVDFAAALAAGGALAALEAPFDAKGLAALRWGERDLLASAQPRLRSVWLEATTTEGAGQPQRRFEPAPLEGAEFAADPESRTVSLSFPWGAFHVAYLAEGDRLTIRLTVQNRGTRPIAGFTIVPLVLRFPETPRGWEKAAARMERSFDNLAAVTAGWDGGQVVVCLDPMESPMGIGFDRPTDSAKTEYPLLWDATVAAPDPSLVFIHPLGLARIEPGAERTFTCSIRFAPPERFLPEILPDLIEAFRRRHPPLNDWPDRRPIGTLFLPSGGPHKSSSNPRGWFQKADLDVRSPEGLERFRALVANYATRAAAVLREMDAQGGIVWNLEGEENPHPITYIGDPRMLPLLAPEMDAVADDLFRILTNAGLRVGVTIRPTQVYYQKDKNQWAHGTGSHGSERNPLNEDFSAIWPSGLPWYQFYPVVERMCRKIEYAKRRWGCTLFYIDTNGLFVPQGPNLEFKWMLLTGDMLRAIRQRHPDVLLIPELPSGDGAYRVTNWGYGAQYMEIDMGGWGTPEKVRWLYPSAFSVINVADGPLEEVNRAVLREAVRKGDILMSRGWFGDPRNAIVSALMREEAPSASGR